MHASIWALLPPELLDRILAGLPVVQLFRLRTVCKRFRALIQSPSFLSLRTAMAPPEHWLLVFYLEDELWVSAYDPRVKHWYNLPVQHPSLPVQDPSSLEEEEDYWSDDDYHLASAEGLLCVPPMVSTQTLVVWNPLTNMWRELPGMWIKGEGMHEGLMVDSTTKAFMVVAVGQTETEEPLTITEVFDSAEGFWKKFMHPSFTKWHISNAGGLVYSNGSFHGIASYLPYQNHSTSYDILVSCDLKQGVWKETCDLPMGVMPSLFEVTPGRLLLFMAPDLSGDPKSLDLWELKQLECDDVAAVGFVKIATAPQVLIEEVQRVKWEPAFIHCRAIGNLVCFVAPDSFLGLVYDLTRDAWEWLPRHESVPRREDDYLQHVVSNLGDHKAHSVTERFAPPDQFSYGRDHNPQVLRAVHIVTERCAPPDQFSYGRDHNPQVLLAVHTVTERFSPPHLLMQKTKMRWLYGVPKDMNVRAHCSVEELDVDFVLKQGMIKLLKIWAPVLLLIDVDNLDC